jgi:hypothetical protein
MAGIAYPLWSTLKDNVVTILESIATEEAAIDPGRNFVVERDRWRPWIEAQRNVPLVIVSVQTATENRDRTGNRRSSFDDVQVNVDMYVMGPEGEIDPPDVVAAKRLDLLIAQVRAGLTRLAETDFGFAKDAQYGYPIDRSETAFQCTYYDQENEQASGQYAPARWAFTVGLAFIPNDNNTYNAFTELNISVKDEDLEQFAVRFTYP